METTKYLDLNTPLKNKLLTLIFLFYLSISLSAQSVSIFPQKEYLFNSNESNLVVVKVRNNGKSARSIKAYLQLPEAFTVLNHTDTINLKAEEEQLLHFSVYLNNNQSYQSLLIPIILKDLKEQELSRDYLNIQIKPFTDFQLRMQAISDYAIQGKDFLIQVSLNNNSNIPCYGKIYNTELNLNQSFRLNAGETDSLIFKIKDLASSSNFYPLIIYTDYKYIYQDSIKSFTKQFSEIIPYYSLWNSEKSRFRKIPAYFSIKGNNNYRSKNDYNYSLNSYAYANLEEGGSLAWYIKKTNGQYFKSWTDQDDYWFNLRTKHSESTIGKHNFSQSKLMGSHFGHGIESSFYSKYLYLSLSQVKESYRDRCNYLSFSTGLLRGTENNSYNPKDNSLLIIYQKKQKDFSITSNNVSSTLLDNEKLSLNYSFNQVNNVRFNSEFMIFKNQTNKSWQTNRAVFSNDLIIKNETTSFSINSLIQNPKINGELAYNKSLEASLVHREADNFLVNTGFRYQDQKSDYQWMSAYKQINQYQYLKARIRVFDYIYAISDISNNRFNSSNRTYDSKDKTALYGTALIDKQFYGELLYGQRHYNYYNNDKCDELWQLNLRYSLMDNFVFNNENHVVKNSNKVDVSNYISAEFKPYSKVLLLLGLEHNHFQRELWRDVFIINTDCKIELGKAHFISMSSKFYNYTLNKQQSNYSLSLEYSIPIQMPLIPRKKTGGIIISIKDPYLLKPVTNALVSANQYFMLTDEQGKAEFNNLPKDKYVVEIKNLPESCLSKEALPLTLELTSDEMIKKDIQIVSPGIVRIKINEYKTESLVLDKNTNIKSAAIFNNELVSNKVPGVYDISHEIRFIIEMDSMRYSKEFDIKGELEFSQLKPGTWKLKIDKETLTELYDIDFEEADIIVESNSKQFIEVNLYPRISEFESFKKGSINIK